jgi:8-oxo-dGTP pyrophosphatase MutT (NUDIX family)
MHMDLVTCRTLYNREKVVPAESLVQRPAVYGVVVHDGRLLVAEAVYTRRYVLPGGGIEKGEAIEDALVREVREETGIEVEVGAFLHFQTDLFYYDPMALAIHGFMFYYQCTPLTTTLAAPDYPEEEGLVRPLWVEIATLRAEQFQSHGELILRLVPTPTNP